MSERRFDDERRRLREEMEAEIEKVRAAYRPRFEAIDAAENQARPAARGKRDTAPSEPAPADRGRAACTASSPSGLRRDLRRLLAGWTGELEIGDVRERLPGFSAQEIRACLDRMAKDREVRILRAGDAVREPLYEALEPDYGNVG